MRTEAELRPITDGRRARIGLRTFALGYLGLLLVGPVLMVFFRAFEDGIGAFFDALTTPNALSALWLTLVIAAITVPLNAVFGTGLAVLMVRGPRWLQTPIGAVVNLPFAVPPVVIGLALVLLYGRTGFLGQELAERSIQVIFSPPGMVIATVFISLPFVAREAVPLLRELGEDSEEAARTLGAGPWHTFRRVTLPALMPALAYGVVLTTARALGEFGAVSVVSGRILGETQTLPIFVKNRYDQFDPVATYAASVVLAVLALLVLALMIRLQKEEEKAWPSESTA